jgi:hypothetical protein
MKMSSHASFGEAVIGAVQSLRGSKLRSFLTPSESYWRPPRSSP